METLSPKEETGREKLIAEFNLSADATDEEIARAFEEKRDIGGNLPTDAEFSEFMKNAETQKTTSKAAENSLIESLNSEELKEKFQGYEKNIDGADCAKFTLPGISTPYLLNRNHVELRLDELKREIKRTEGAAREMAKLNLDRMQGVLDNWPED